MAKRRCMDEDADERSLRFKLCALTLQNDRSVRVALERCRQVVPIQQIQFTEKQWVHALSLASMSGQTTIRFPRGILLDALRRQWFAWADVLIRAGASVCQEVDDQGGPITAFGWVYHYAPSWHLLHTLMQVRAPVFPSCVDDRDNDQRFQQGRRKMSIHKAIEKGECDVLCYMLDSGAPLDADHRHVLDQALQSPRLQAVARVLIQRWASRALDSHSAVLWRLKQLSMS